MVQLVGEEDPLHRDVAAAGEEDDARRRLIEAADALELPLLRLRVRDGPHEAGAVAVDHAFAGDGDALGLVGPDERGVARARQVRGDDVLHVAAVGVVAPVAGAEDAAAGREMQLDAAPEPDGLDEVGSTVHDHAPAAGLGALVDRPLHRGGVEGAAVALRTVVARVEVAGRRGGKRQRGDQRAERFPCNHSYSFICSWTRSLVASSGATTTPRSSHGAQWLVHEVSRNGSSKLSWSGRTSSSVPARPSGPLE